MLICKKRDILQEMAEIFSNLKSYILSLSQDVDKAEEYLSGNMSKIELHLLFLQPSFIYLQDKVLNLNNFLSETLLTKYIKSLLSENQIYIAMYKFLFNFKFPLLNSANIIHYALVKEAQRLSNEFNQTKMGEVVALLNDDLEANFLQLVQEFHRLGFSLPDQIQDKIIKNLVVFLQTLTSFQKLLQDYQDKFNLDTDFFM